ncbi:MAG: imidazolonepropionase [Paracoccaceae bacterium]
MLFTNAKIATCGVENPYGLIENGALAVMEEQIGWVGDANEIPAAFADLIVQDLGGRLITPGLIDCHTHIVHGGNRAREFEQRLTGISYEEIARQGGGILSTVTATRDAGVEALVVDALPRVDALIAEGVCTLEVKSGYGLDIETELNMLRAARRIESERRIRVVTSFLGAHAIPPEYKGDPQGYLDNICLPTLNAAHDEGLVDAVDGFCENIAFTPEQIAQVFDVAKSLGLPVKLHAEQLSHLGGAALAAQYGALSADHVEYATERDASVMGAAGTAAVLLPGAFYTVRETQVPPVDAFRKHGVPMALATDCNPGSSPLTSLLLAMNMGCTLFRMSPEEALRGTTQHAAFALGLKDCGKLESGQRADLAIWNVAEPAELSYRIGYNPLHQRIFAGAV